MNVLHLTSQYTVSAVYKELFTHLCDYENIQQTVFIGTRKDSVVDRYKIENKNNLKFIIDYTHGKFARILYYPRIVKVLKKIEKEVNLENIDIVHAHTLFGDGGTALLIKKIYGIDYVVTVRSTDVSGYLKKMPHALILLNEIVINAKNIIFISPSMYNIIYDKLNKKARNKLKQKKRIIPNGISEFWFENIGKNRKLNKEKRINFIQVSELIKRKNIDKSVEIIKKICDMGIESHLDVVGDGSFYEEYCKIIHRKGLDKYVTFLGKIKEENAMKNCYNEHDIFIMPSENETFGLVYVEAMSQGLPIVYHKNTGIFGYFEEGDNGYGINSYDLNEAVEFIKKILENYDEISKKCIINSREFNWFDIAKKLKGIYTSK